MSKELVAALEKVAETKAHYDLAFQRLMAVWIDKAEMEPEPCKHEWQAVYNCGYADTICKHCGIRPNHIE